MDYEYFMKKALEQAEQALRNMLNALAACGKSKENLAFVEIMMTPSLKTHFGLFNEVWLDIMDGVAPKPCRKAYRVVELPFDAMVEVTGFAV